MRAQPVSRSAPWRSLSSAVALAGLLAGACGASAPIAGPITPGTPSAPRIVNVIMRDYGFEPTPLRLVRGETVRFNIIDAGLLAHDFVLGRADVQAAWAAAEAAATPPIITATPPPVTVPAAVAGLRVYLHSGESDSVLYTVPVDGGLQLACAVPGHAAQGMVGVVAYVEPSPP
ncbi:MAG: hypothetical protein ACRDF7_01415 [Candidatus Limnocylindrales bacterium]